MLTTWLLAFCIGAVHLGSRSVTASLPPLNRQLNMIYEWKYLDFVFANETQRVQAIQSGQYNHTKCFPIDVDRWRDLTFVTVIREEGVPSSLNVISNQTGDGGPLLKPYPDWSWTKTDCTGITSVYRVAIDRCNRLWVLDTGVIGEKAVCSPQLLAFDLETSQLLERVTIAHDVAVNSTSGKGLLVTPIVQTFGGLCEETYVYMADVSGYALLFYNHRTQTTRRFTSSALVYDPQLSSTTYTIEGQSFTLEDGPVGMALSPLSQTLYFSPMSSHNMGSIQTDAVIAANNNDLPFKEYKNVLRTQSSAKAMTYEGTLFLGLVNNTAIGCWHEFMPLEEKNIVVISQDSETLQFTSGMKVKTPLGVEELLVMTNRYQKIATGTMNFSDVNFRILSASVKQMVIGTPCAPLLFFKG
ncbi:major royal jelly protein 9-like isoform X2 [Andrena cerasifolii]